MSCTPRWSWNPISAIAWRMSQTSSMLRGNPEFDQLLMGSRLGSDSAVIAVETKHSTYRSPTVLSIRLSAFQRSRAGMRLSQNYLQNGRP